MPSVNELTARDEPALLQPACRDGTPTISSAVCLFGEVDTDTQKPPQTDRGGGQRGVKRVQFD